LPLRSKESIMCFGIPTINTEDVFCHDFVPSVSSLRLDVLQMSRSVM